MKRVVEKFSDNFDHDELVRNNHGIALIPTPEQLANAQALVDNALQPTRNVFGQPIIINSWLRNETLNQKVGGSRTSEHLTGGASDITSNDNRKLLRDLFNNATFDQLIVVGSLDAIRFIHVGHRRPDARGRSRNRFEVKRKIGSGSSISYVAITAQEIKLILSS